MAANMNRDVSDSLRYAGGLCEDHLFLLQFLPIQHSPSNSGVSEVDALRKRLEQLKGSARESQ
jgi:hypothetical protein